ncbi:toxin-antitoxin system YwqK family antitoxin [Pontibacter toksunensis]|uniref:Toxin-antitoxin system YwqK family antitoxin n=1 Tax=Pontibacter toksunensis TaxID=1332631 RepID=A0ABW6BZ67_9BACT
MYRAGAYFALFVVLLVCISCSGEGDKLVKFHPDGSKMLEVGVKNGKPEGRQINYFPNGKVSGISYYKNGKLNGEAIGYYENGKIETSINYVDGLMDGLTRYYYENGTIEQEAAFTKDHFQGWVKFYNKNGQLSAKHEYFSQDGKEWLNQRIHYDEYGKIMKDSSNYITLTSIYDTIQLNEKYQLSVKLETPMSGGSKMEVHFEGFDNDYKLIQGFVPETVKAAAFVAKIAIEPEKKGENIIRGRVVNYKLEGDSTWEKLEKHIYFTKKYYVE